MGVSEVSRAYKDMRRFKKFLGILGTFHGIPQAFQRVPEGPS